MNNIMRKFVVVLMAMLFFGSLIVPNIGGADSREQVWTSGIDVTEIMLEGNNPSESGAYPNGTYDVKVMVMNDGETKLVDINVTCMITSGATTYMDAWNTTITELAIGASDYVYFTWDNIMEGSFDINATATADSFGSPVNDWMMKAVIIQDITVWTVEKFDLKNASVEAPMAFDGSYRLNHDSTHDINYTLQIYVKNTGNQIINGPVALEASFYEAADPTGVAARWTNSTEIAGNINAGFEAAAEFTLPFNGTVEGMKTINVTAGGQNFTLHFELKNVTNFEVTQINQYINYKYW
jgi:hypothetical protein